MKNSYQIIGWVARILCIGAIVFVSIFALDAFAEGKPLMEQLKDFFMHLLPSFVLIIFLYISWKKSIIGGIIFLITGIALTPWVYDHNFNMNDSVMMSIGIVATITLPFIIVGILFIWSGRLKNKYLKNKNLET
jgi:hypothetical protein